jgi:HlyD family secretion protein
MGPAGHAKNWFYGLAAVVLMSSLAAVGIVLYLAQTTPSSIQVDAQESRPEYLVSSQSTVASVDVDVVRPQKGMDYELELPGSVQAFETVHLHAKVSGFLKTQTVDIGARVKRGDLLAVIAVPELEKQAQRNEASVVQAQARVRQMTARLSSAEADHEAAKAAVEQADATFKSSAAWVRFRGKQYQRMKDLFTLSSIEERLVDESKERYEASLETEHSSKAAIATAKAHLAAAAAKILVAEADVSVARSEIDVTQADLDKTHVLLDYAVITAPFDGEICLRSFFPGDFIRSASEGATQIPLLTIQRTNVLRVVVQVPDRDVPYLDKGDPAIVRIDSLPGKKFVGTVSRKAGSEDPQTRLMHVEIDLPNPTGEMGDGMYGKVRILLDRFPKLLSVPLGPVFKTSEGGSAIWVVRAGHIHRADVRLGKDNGTRVTVLSGLRPDDLVITSHSGAALVEGGEAQYRIVPEPPVHENEDS